jgi:hypothetical protein
LAFSTAAFSAASLLAAAAPSARGGIKAWRIIELTGFPHADRGAFNQPVGAIYHYAVSIGDAAQNIG